MADSKPPSERETEPHETRRLSFDSDFKIWARFVTQCKTRSCACGRKIDSLMQHGKTTVIVRHDDGFYNPLTCSFRGVISPEMQEFYNDAKTDT